MTAWLAGMLITADRLNDGIDADVQTTGLTAATGFSVNDFEGKISGQICTVDVYVQKITTTIVPTASTGNIADTDIATLPVGYRPTTHTIEAIWDDGAESGGATIGTDGVVTIRTVTYNQTILTGKNLRVHGSFIL